MLIYNYNGFIVPFLIKRKLNIIDKKTWPYKLFNHVMLVFFIVGGSLGFANDIYEKFKKA